LSIQYWRNRDRYYRLLGNKCTACGHEHFPPVYRCRKCGSELLEEMEMPRTGKIITYTELHEPLPGFEEQAPFHLAVVELTNGSHVLSQVVDTPPEAIKIGAKVSVVFRRISVDGPSGQIHYGYKFRVED